MIGLVFINLSGCNRRKPVNDYIVGAYDSRGRILDQFLAQLAFPLYEGCERFGGGVPQIFDSIVDRGEIRAAAAEIVVYLEAGPVETHFYILLRLERIIHYPLSTLFHKTRSCVIIHSLQIESRFAREIKQKFV